MESSSAGDDDDCTSRPPAAYTAPTAATNDIFPFLMNRSSGILPFLHGNDGNPPLTAFETLPNSFDQISPTGSTNRHHHHHQSQHFRPGAADSGDELGAMLTPPALRVTANLGYRPDQSKTSDELTGGRQNLAAPLIFNPSKLSDERPEMRNNNGALPAQGNPKKRRRASRRAPTTVLTTDASNFREMVQEFTGIPSPPFAAETSPFQPIFASSSTVLGLGSSQPSYLLRPFAQKLFQAAPPPSRDNTGISTFTGWS